MKLAPMYYILPAESGEGLTKAQLFDAAARVFDAPAEENPVLKLFDGFLWKSNEAEGECFSPACVSDVAITLIRYTDNSGKHLELSGACKADIDSELPNSNKMSVYGFVATFDTEAKRGVFGLQYEYTLD